MTFDRQVPRWQVNLTVVLTLTVLQELAHAEMIRSLKLEQAKELTKLRQEFELAARELAGKYEKKMKMLRDDLELRRKQEIHEIEERKVATTAVVACLLGSLKSACAHSKLQKCSSDQPSALPT